MATGTVRLHRVLRTTPDKVYRAFTDAGAMAKWLPPFGFICSVDHLEARVGGTFRMAFRNFGNGQGHAFGGTYLELVPGKLIRYNDRFDDPNMPGQMEVAIRLAPVACGTDVHIEQSGIPEMIPVEMCYLGWQESLLQLANLVEPNIPQLDPAWRATGRVRFWLDRRAGPPPGPGHPEGIRRYWTPDALAAVHARLRRPGYAVSAIGERDYGPTESAVADDDGHQHRFGVAIAG